MAAAGQTEPVRRISCDQGDEKSSDLSHETLMWSVKVTATPTHTHTPESLQIITRLQTNTKMQRRKQKEYKSFVFQSEGTFTFSSCRSSCSTRGRPTGNKKQRRDDLDEPEHKYHTAAPFSPRQQMLVFKPNHHLFTMKTNWNTSQPSESTHNNNQLQTKRANSHEDDY